MIEKHFRDLSMYETSLLNALLATPFPGRDSLVDQLTVCQARRYDDNGSFEFKVDRLRQAASIKCVVPVEAEYEDKDGIIIHFLLHVNNSCLKELEIYKEDNSKIVLLPDPNLLRVFAPQ